MSLWTSSKDIGHRPWHRRCSKSWPSSSPPPMLLWHHVYTTKNVWRSRLYSCQTGETSLSASIPPQSSFHSTTKQLPHKHTEPAGIVECGWVWWIRVNSHEFHGNQLKSFSADGTDGTCFPTMPIWCPSRGVPKIQVLQTSPNHGFSHWSLPILQYPMVPLKLGNLYKW